MTHRDLESINAARRFAGLPELKLRQNRCKRCDKKFEAYDRWSFCPACRACVAHQEWGVLADLQEQSH